MVLGVAVIAARLPRSTAPSAGALVDVGARRLPGWVSGRVAALVALSVAYHFTYGPFETVMPYFTRDQLGSGVGGYTLLWVLFGVAALATLPLAPRLSVRRPGVVNAVGAIVWGLATLPMVFTQALPLAAAIFVVSGAVWGPYSAVEATAIQRWTDPANHGRVYGTQRALLAMASPLGAAVGAVAVDHTRPAVILAASALGCSVAGLLALFPMRRADRPVSQAP
jgi:hypothetical protein